MTTTKKKKRRVRTRSDSTETGGSDDPGGYLERWAGVVQGVVDLDPEEVHARLEEALQMGDTVTGSALLVALDEAQANYLEAGKLADRARLEYDLYRETVWAPWLEERKTASRLALEQAKAEGNLKKTISDDMIMDQVRVTYRDEYAERFERLKRFQAAVHTLERMVDVWKSRSRSLTDMKDLVLSMGSTGSRR